MSLAANDSCILHFLQRLKTCPGSKPDQHVLGPAGPLLDAGAGRAAAVQRHGGHEPVDHRRPEPGQRQQEEEEGVRSSQSQENV